MEFHPHYIEAGIESVTEFGVFNPDARRWVARRGETIDYQPTAAPISLRESFPDEETAGSEEFARRLLRDILDGGRIFDRYTRAFSEYGFDQMTVYRFQSKRPRRVASGMEERKLEGRGVLFDMRGPRGQMREWKEHYLRLHPSALISTLENGPRPLLRVWHAN